MSGARSFLAAGIVGAVVWAFKREAERQQAQAGGQSAAPSVFPASTSKGGMSDKTIDAFGKLFSEILSGSGTSVAPQQSRTTSVFSRLKSSGNYGAGVNAILALIRSKESRGNYDIVYYGSKIKTPRRLTQMTVGQVRAWQDQSVRAGSKSSAVGAYQIIRKTMDLLISMGALKRNELFSVAAQDRAAIALLKRRGLDTYKAGGMSAEAFANNIAKEWASFPVVTGSKKGRSYYAGDGLNKALIGVEPVMRAVRAI